MKRYVKIIFLSIIFLGSNILLAQDQCKVVGWATQNGGVTGGGNATPTVVSTYAALKTALTTSSVKVVHVSGTITFPTNGRITIQDTDGKTIIGLAGSKLVSVDMTASGSGILYVKRTTNLIMRNLTFEGPGAYDVDGNDNLTFDDVQNAWVDHCDFQDGMDGNFDMKNMTDYISVTWCKFSYNKPPKAGGSGGTNDHRFTDLIGSSDGATQDDGKLRITFQYCWWAQGCVERMPRVRFGKLHIANCFYNSTVSNSCIRAGYKADLLIESNVFIGVKKPIDLYNNDFTAVTARNNTFTNTTGGTTGSGTSFTPPYSLTIAAAGTVQSLVTNTACGSGATLDSPTQCGCGTVVNQNPVATLTAPSSGTNGCVGTAITISATATDDGSISKVDFYNGTTLLGSDNSSPYSYSYTPTAASTLTLKVIATDNAGLTGTSSTVSITVNALPTATVSSSTTNLCTTGSIVLTASSGSSYKWFNGTTQVGTASTYTATTAGNYTVEVTNTSGCKATSAARTLTGSAQPTPTITSPATSFCTGGSVVLTSSSGSSYKWFNGTTQVGTASTYTATAAGAYTIEVTNASGCKATSAVTQIAVNALPTATVSSSTTNLCTTGSIVLTASSGSSYKWFNGTTQVGTASSYTATTAGDYTVEITNASNCKATSAVRTLTGSAQPTPTITSPATSFCTGGSVVLTSSSGSSYKWFNGTTQVGTASTYTATAAGAYTVEVTNASGCKATSAATQITVSLAITPTITTPSTSICDGASAVLTASAGASYKWFNGSTQVGTASTYTATTAGAYTVEVTYTGGCKATSAVTQIGINALPTASITASATSFCTGGSVLLTASAGTSYKWFNGTTQVGTASTYTATAAGSYTVEVTNANNCKATSAVTQITISAAATPTITAPATSICDGSSVTLTSSAGVSYKWFNGSTQVGTASTYTATAAGAYTVEVTYTGGCKATSAVTQIGINALPTATITAPSTSICAGGSVTLTASAGTSYKWFNGTTQAGTAATYTATASGSYTVEVTNANGCKATSTATQISISTASTPTITASSTSICDGSSATLTASTGASYKWFIGSTQVGTDVTYTATTSGAYTVEVTYTGGCKATSSVTQIGILSLPTATINASTTTFCTGKSAILAASTGTSYKWFNGTTQVGTAATYTATASGDYTVEVTNSNNCKATSAVTQINVTTIPSPTITSAATSICAGSSVILSSSTAVSYKWFNGTTQVGTSSAYTVKDAGTYSVEITDANGCKATSAATQITIGSAVTWYADTDNDGMGDASNPLSACSKPNGYVATSGDACPMDANKTEPGNCGCNHTETPACITTATITNTNATIKVVPQPFDDATSVSLENYGTIQSITIISSAGAIVETKQNINAETILIGETLASGLYTLLIQSEKGMYTTKIVKK